MIIDRYLSREITQPFWAVLFALIVIFITFSLSRYLVSADAGLLKVGEVLQLTLFRAIISLEVLLPLSLYLAIMTGLGRLYTDSEIHAMRAGGISEIRLLRPVMRLSLVLAIIVALLSTWVRPWAYVQSYAVTATAAASAETGRIKASRFYTFGKSKRTVFIEHIAANGRDLRGIFIRTRKGDDLQVITASEGVFSHLAKPLLHRLELRDVRIFRKVSDGTDFSARLGSYTLWLQAEVPQPPDYQVKSTSSMGLSRSDDPVDQAEFQWRMSTPISSLLLALLAIPLSRSRPRQGRYAKMLLAVGIYAIYFTLLDISRSWVQQGSEDYIWWVPILLGLVVGWFYWPIKQQLRRWRSVNT